jgi:signal transduction histidine kinase
VDDLEIAQWVAEAFGWAMIAILLSIFALSYGVAYYVASRFNRIAATTQRIIATGNLGERLQVDSNWDDLSKLTRLLNQMLEELETRVDGIKSVSDSIAHDLRTPLTRLRYLIEERVASDSRVELLEEVDRIMRIFNSLLRISSVEAGKQPLVMDDVPLSALIEDAIDLYEPLLADSETQICTSFSDSLHLRGDRDLLFQLFANIVDNAIKFTPAGGKVLIFGQADRQGVSVTVQDSGPGIPADQRSTALQRFGRLDSSRSRPGNGLGLPLAAAIVQRHGGVLELLDPVEAETGLRVRVTLPLDPSQS